MLSPRPIRKTSSPSRRTYVELEVGPFSLALRTECVLGILHEVSLAPTITHREVTLQLADLRCLLMHEERSVLPFVVAVEEGTEHRAAIGVDNVGHVHRDSATALLAVPTFGLCRPDLFEGALRDGERLLLVLSAPRLVELTAQQKRGI